MAKVALKPGAEIEFVTPGELRQIALEVASGLRRPSQIIRPIESVALDESGNASGVAKGCRIYTVPLGYAFTLHRLEIFPEGYTFGVPYTSGSGYLDIVAGQRRRDGVPFTAPGIPRIWSGGTEDGIVGVNGEVIRIDFYDGPVSTNVLVRAQGTLEAIVVTDPPE